MKQVFYHYTKWEDFQNGMYDEKKEGRKERVQLDVKILSDLELLYQSMTDVTKYWIHATEQELTNSSINHRAFLGQAACNFYAGVKEDETREAWGFLTNEQRINANKVADRVIAEWENHYMKDKENYQYSLFGD